MGELRVFIRASIKASSGHMLPNCPHPSIRGQFRISQEFYMSSWDFYGVPTDLAIHLLDLHWNRQHHSFLLTYRPAIMRSLAAGGSPYCSKLLLNVIFACVAKYSDRLEVRSNPNDPRTAGVRSFQRVKELLPLEMETSSISLVVALLMQL